MGVTESARIQAVRLARRWPLALAVAHGMARRFAARHRVGALAVILDSAGQVLLVRHALRNSRWALPGGWIRSHEEPSSAARREVREELGLEVSTVATVASESHGARVRRVGGPPSGLTIVVLCRSQRESPDLHRSEEIIQARWMLPSEAVSRLSPFEAGALIEALARIDRGVSNHIVATGARSS